MKIISLALASFFVASTALAASPDWSRTRMWPFTGQEFSTVAPQGGCVPAHGCFRAENWTEGYWVSPGLEGVAGASPGNALVVDADGIVHGIYVGTYTAAGTYKLPNAVGVGTTCPDRDPNKRCIPAITGDFYPALAPAEGGVKPRAYVTVDPGVTTVLATKIQFRADATKTKFAYDTRLERIVEYMPGKGVVVGHCSTYNDVTSRSGSPELAAITCR